MFFFLRFLSTCTYILMLEICFADGEDQAAFFGLREAGSLIFDTNIGIIIVNNRAEIEVNYREKY